MRSTTVFATFFAFANAQNLGAKPNCTKFADLKPVADPLKLFPPGSADFHCDMGVPIPYGPAPTGCAKLELLVARGTSEPGPFGQVVGDPLVARVKRDLIGATFQGYAVQYPAGLNRSELGVADIPKRMEAQIKACPGIKFALAGYSQGGGVVSRAISNMTSSLSDQVVAVILYGAGDGSSMKDPLKAKTLANCAPGDFACPNSGTGPGHVSYNNEGTIWHDRSTKYIIEGFNGKGLGKKTLRSPTDLL
ncbi:alpha/beta-hydrolase [Tothia fuscella]|uniref:Alpha/beta-hydrolase n=1 Tax=Tothia fuscella TaxID=1048955 RepID=A0A9P4TZK9_9PEZI|nr:alpha/beta-hydrolase [Tothia fuscella]